MKLFVYVKRLFQRDDRGVTAIEYALLAPVFLVIVFAVLQISIAFHKGNTAQWAVKKAARQLLVNDDLDEDGLQEIVNEHLTSLGEDLTIDIAYTVDESGTVPIGRITATYTHQIVVPAVSTFTARFPIDVSVPHSIG